MMFVDDEIFQAACAAYGDCIGDADCNAEVAEFLMKDFDLGAEAAANFAAAAFEEWCDAYE